MLKKLNEVAVDEREAIYGGKGTVKMQHYFKATDFAAPIRMCARITIPPGGSIGEHAHLKEDEIYIVLEGNGVIVDNGKELPIGVGDAILTGQGGKHGIMNNTEKDLVFAAIVILYQTKS